MCIRDRCPWVSRGGIPTPGRPADTRHWPTGSDSSTSPSEGEWLTTDGRGGTLSGARVSEGKAGTSSTSPLWHWQYLVIKCTLSLLRYVTVCISRCGPRLSLVKFKLKPDLNLISSSSLSSKFKFKFKSRLNLSLISSLSSSIILILSLHLK